MFTVVPAPHFKRLSKNRSVRAFVDGVTAAATGAIAGAAFVLGRRALVDWGAAVIGIVTLAILWRAKKVPEPLLIVLAGLVGVALKAAGR